MRREWDDWMDADGYVHEGSYRRQANIWKQACEMGPQAFWENTMDTARPYTRPGEQAIPGKPVLVETVFCIKDETGRRVHWKPKQQNDDLTGAGEAECCQKIKKPISNRPALTQRVASVTMKADPKLNPVD